MVFQVAINELERLILKTAEAVSCSRKVAIEMPAMTFKKSVKLGWIPVEKAKRSNRQ